MAGRRTRDARSLRPITLILCEGRKAEPNYFDAIARRFGITSFIIPRDDETDPLNLVRRMASELKSRSGKAISRAYVVVDLFEHANYRAAFDMATRLEGIDGRFSFIPSFPSFALWLLLHFEFTRAPFTADDVLAKLKGYVPDYEKGSARIMDEIAARVEIGIENAERSWVQAVNDGEPNSSSKVFKLLQDVIG